MIIILYAYCITMSLNKLLTTGLVDDGLDIKCSSMQCLSTIVGSTFNSIVTVEEKLYCNDDLNVIGLTETGFLKVGGRSVVLNGILSVDDANLTAISNVTNVTMPGPYSWQKYGDTLHIQGEFECDWNSISSSFGVVAFVLPSQYVFTTDDNMVCVGAGFTSPVVTNVQGALVYNCKPSNTTVLQLFFGMGDGKICAINGSHYRVSFSCTLTDVYLA